MINDQYLLSINDVLINFIETIRTKITHSDYRYERLMNELGRIQSNLKNIISSIANNEVANISDFVIADIRLRIKQYTIELKRTNNTRLKLQDVNITIAKELTQIITRLITCQKGNDNAYKYLIHVIDYFSLLTHFEV